MTGIVVRLIVPQEGKLWRRGDVANTWIHEDNLGADIAGDFCMLGILNWIRFWGCTARENIVKSFGHDLQFWLELH